MVIRPNEMSGAAIVDLCRRHTVFEWSAQSKVDPIPVARAERVYFWTPEGKAPSYCHLRGRERPGAGANPASRTVRPACRIA